MEDFIALLKQEYALLSEEYQQQEWLSAHRAEVLLDYDWQIIERGAQYFAVIFPWHNNGEVVVEEVYPCGRLEFAPFVKWDSDASFNLIDCAYSGEQVHLTISGNPVYWWFTTQAQHNIYSSIKQKFSN